MPVHSDIPTQPQSPEEKQIMDAFFKKLPHFHPFDKCPHCHGTGRKLIQPEEADHAE